MRTILLRDLIGASTLMVYVVLVSFVVLI